MDIAREFDRCLGIIHAKVAPFPWHDPVAYASWVAQTHYFVQHTTRLLALAASKLGTDQDEAHQHMLSHLREESGHDQLAVRDLKALGYARGELPELMQTSIFYQIQYDWIERGHPAALQGYALLLEGLAAREAAGIASAVDKHHGKGKTAFLRVHAADDVAHFADGLTKLQRLPSSVTGLVLRNLQQSTWLYAAMLDGVVEFAAAKRPSQGQHAA